MGQRAPPLDTDFYGKIKASYVGFGMPERKEEDHGTAATRLKRRERLPPLL